MVEGGLLYRVIPESLIEDLESYKKSLIYEVVTGKRKVAFPLPAELLPPAEK